MSSVSVVIPCYKYGHFLEGAVSSVLEDQEGVDVRVLIIDDASPDDSAGAAQSIAARDPRVDVLVHETNRGNIATYNEGLLEWAGGDYCLLMSADDRATPGALRRAADLLDAHPNVGFVYGHAIWAVDGDPVPPARTHVRGWSVWSGERWLERRFHEAENPINSPEIIVRTSLQKRVGGYDPGLPHSADMEMYLRLAAYSDVGFLRGVDQAYYRVHSANMSKAVSVLGDLHQRRCVVEMVLERYGERLADTARLSAIVHRQLGREALWAAARGHLPGRVRRSAVGRRLVCVGTCEDGQDIDGLLEFATECWPDVQEQALYRRLAAGERLRTRDVLYMADQKGHWWLRRKAWKYRGV